MIVSRLMRATRFAAVGVIGLIGIGALTSTEAQAATTTAEQCGASGGAVQLQSVGLQNSTSVTLVAYTPEGPWVGEGQFRVFCTADNNDIENVTVAVKAFDAPAPPAATFLINDQPGPVNIGPVTGWTSFKISSPTPELNLAVQPVGTQLEFVVSAGTSNYNPWYMDLGVGAVVFGTQYAGGTIFAALPELSSVVLFGFGALLAGGYVLKRTADHRRRRI